MIIQFPTPFKSELLYSVIGRYHLRSGNISWLHTIDDLFGNRTTNATALLPSNIAEIVKRLPKNTTINEKLLVEKHTLYPFYTAFLEKERAMIIYQSVLSDGKPIYRRAGIMPSAIPQNKYFHYCSICLQEQENEYGEMYWDRLQQLPGKLICLKHGIRLEESSIPLVQKNKCSYVLPNRDNCNLGLVRSISEPLKEEYFRLLNEVQILLNIQWRHYSYDEWTAFYRRKLIEFGYANRNGIVNQIKLHEDFFYYYSKELLSNLGIKTTYWLRLISQKHRKSFHPFYHILLLNFLGVTVKDLFSEFQIKADKKEQIKLPYPQYQKDVSEDYASGGNIAKVKNKPKILEKMNQKRQTWLQLQEQNPKMSKTELRKIQPSIYTFLYRYDRNWLNENSPNSQKKKRIDKRVDWQKRDREVLEKVIKATEELLGRRENLRRITIKSLGDETGELALLDNQLNKMPKTKAYIQKVKESGEEFRKRRVLQVIEDMKKEGKPIRKSNVLKKAGIKSKFYNEVECLF